MIPSRMSPATAGGVIFALLGALLHISAPTEWRAARQAPALANTHLSQMPLFFEENLGAIPGTTTFTSRGERHSLLLTATEAVMKIGRSFLRMKPVGANPTPALSGLEPLLFKTHYFSGNDPDQWRTNVPNFAKVRYQAVYPGIDLVYYGNQRDLEFDFIVAPQADPAAIQLGFEGTHEMYIDGRGDLVLQVGGENIILQKPVIYQEVAGVRREVPGRYLMRNARQVGFWIGAYDAALPLVIDPVLTYTSYLGGSGEDVGLAVAADPAGNAYVTGYTISTDFPTHNAIQPASGGGHDVFVAKLDSTGSTFLYVTYLGGANTEHGQGIAVDATGNAYVTGYTESPNFPTANAFQAVMPGSRNAFVTKLNASGSALVYSTYLGGSHGDIGYDIAVNAAGHVFVIGSTISANFPTLNPIQAVPGGGNCATPPSTFPCEDAFVSQLNASGSALIYSTYLGGIGGDIGQGLALDSSGAAYLIGITSAPNFPVVAAFQPSFGGGQYDAFVAKLNPAGSALDYATYLGGSDDDYGNDIAVDGFGAAHLTGNTRSLNFPIANALQPTIGATNGFDAFVTKFDPTGAALVYSTYLGAQGDDLAYGIGLDAANNTYVTGLTRSPNFPTVNAFQPSYGGSGTYSGDAFISKLNAAGSGLAYSSFLGGNGDENVYGGGFCGDIAIDASGAAYVSGCTSSTNLATAGTAQSTLGGFYDAFLAKISDTPPPPTFAFTGFFQPVDNLPTLNEVKAGRAIPVKFSLNGDQGLAIFAAGYPKSEEIACNSTVLVDGIEETVTTGSSSLSYNPSTDHYTYVWKTDTTWANTCRQLVVKLSDNTFHRANFKFK